MPNKKTRSPSDLQKKFIVRFPAGMHEKIKALAKTHGSSMNEEVIKRLEWSFREEEKPPDDALQAAIRRAEDQLEDLRRLATALEKKK